MLLIRERRPRARKDFDLMVSDPQSPGARLRERVDLIERIGRYFAWLESPQFEPCPRCHGKGYHHGFGEHGADPDWCEKCGGPGEQPTEPGTWSPDDLLREAAEALRDSFPRTGAEGWQPIETAPKDGSYMVLRVDVARFRAGAVIGRWYSFGKPLPDGVTGQWEAHATDVSPTHWMPLPSPPAGSALETK